MSLQQSKAEKNDAAPVRRAGGGGKSGASAAAHPPKGGVGGPSPHNAPNTSGKRANGPGGQSRGNPNAVGLHTNAYAAKAQNGGIAQRQQTGSTSASGSLPISTTKHPSGVGTKSNGILPKPHISSNLKVSEQTSSSSTAAVLGESTRAMAQQPLFQFGSFSPTSIHGFQVPARTSSAPPNFDEQKRDQARSGPPIDVSKTSSQPGTSQLEGPVVSKQAASTLDTKSEGNKILQGPKAAPPFVQAQDVPGGQIPSTLPLRSNYPPSAQLQSHGATSGSRVTSSHLQSHGVAPVPRAPSSHLQSQGAPTGPHAPISQMQSQGAAVEPHAPSYKYQSQSAIPVPRGQSSQLQPQGGTHGLHALSSQLQSQVATTGLYAPSSQLQSQGVAPGSRSLQLPLQVPQVQPQVFSSQGLTAGALHSQGMLHHGLGYPQAMRHIIPQQTHVPSQQFIHGNHQINAQIPIQVTGSVGTHLPSYVPATQANQYVPHRTSTVKITHPKTHEEIKIGPKAVKSDSHADGGIVSDGSLPGGLAQYGTPHSGSVSISGLSQMNFYPTASSGSYAHPPTFHQPPKITAAVRPNIARPSSTSNSPPVNLHGANVDTSKHPSQTGEASLALVKASEGKTLTSTISVSQSSHSSNSLAISASVREDTGNPAVSKSDLGVKRSIMNMPATATHNHADGNVSASSAVFANEEQKSESVKSDVGVKHNCTNMSATATHNLSDGNVSNSSAVSAVEEQKSESLKPVGVSTKEHSKKASKLESKPKRHQQQASLSRTSTNAQVELKVEALAESSEVCGSADASKSGLSQVKQKKQQQQPLLRSSSNARIEVKGEVATESSEVGSSTSNVPLVTAASKTVKPGDGGASPELARKAIETVLQSSCTEPGAVVFLSNSTSIPIKTDKISMSKSVSGDVSNNTEFSSLEISGHSRATDKVLSNDLSSGALESVQDSDAKDEIVPGNVTSHMEILDQRSGERTELSGLMNKSVAKEVGQPMKVGDVTVCNDTLITSSNSTSREPMPILDSNMRDVKSLESAVTSNLVSSSNSVQSINRDSKDTGILPHDAFPAKQETNLISDSVLSENSSSVNINENPDDFANSVIVNEKARLLQEEAKFNKMKHGNMISQLAELGNGTLVDHQNIKDKKMEELVVTMQSTNSDEAPQIELRSETPAVGPAIAVSDMEEQSDLLSDDKIVDSDQSCLDTCKSSRDIITGSAEPSTANVKKLDVQDKAQVLVSNSSNHEEMAASPWEPSVPLESEPSLPLESDIKLDSLGRVTEKERKSSLNAFSSNKITNTGDVPKAVGGKKKKKLKDCLSKADAADPTGDLYNAYKAPEKQEDVYSVEPCKEDYTDVEEKPSSKETEKHVANEVDDWEDAAELSTDVKQVVPPVTSGGRKYSRDFLLTLKEHFKDLPLEFENKCQEFVDILINRQLISSLYSEGEPLSSMGRVQEYPRIDRRGNNIPSMDEDRWFKPMDAGGRDPRMEMGLGGPGGFRPGQGYNTGFVKNMRGAAPGVGPSGQFVQASFAQSGLMRNNAADVDRWRTSGMQKGLIPPPVIHKTDNRYEVGKVSDDEELKQRKIKSILNKLTPQNFETLFLRVQEVNIDSGVCLTGVISQIFDKALMEPTFCEMYAKFCVQLAAGLPEFYEDNERVMFRRVLLNKCQEEFERDEREQAEADMAEDGEIKLSKEEREGKRSAQRRRMLGNIRFIGELYKESMLTERIMHECIKKLLGEYQKPDEENVESLCKLMSTIGQMIDHPKAREHIDAYFERISKMANNQALPTRLRFMLKDVIDLRKNGWQQRRKVDGPKKIEEVHRDAAQERQQALGGRLNRAPSMGHSGRRISTPPDHGSRGPQMSAFMPGTPMGPAAHMSGMRGTQAQTGMRNYIAQDARISDRMTGDRPSPLQYRPSDDGQLTLGPQGGLGRGISGRGQPMQTNRSSLVDGPLVTPGSNRRGSLVPMAGYNSSYGTRDDIPIRTSAGEKSSFPRSGISERNALGNERRDYRGSYSSYDRGGKAASQEYQQEFSHGREFSEEQLKRKSDMAIKEYYSIRDMKEAALCVSDLKSPWYNPTLVSLWIMDSFDRKDVERDLLGNLFIHLCKTEPSLLSQEQLIKGLEKVIASLEDSVVDAPKAPEFLGMILGKLVVANLLSIRDIAVPLEEGGIEPGSLLDMGLAADVLATILDVLKREKGENVLLDLYRSSGLQLEKFIPLGEKPGKFESLLEKKNIQCLSTIINRHL
ncbi:eukaryotic translation initiation factor 4G isoform X2 [Cryptomeria japonica]|uniref:eukaryotic translation initiation factor 4G isoform X2 n=1 Tax=Cryptomeria japonica TaxID=3369 RepID=UPI0027DA7D0B|nr:eukaryotic translation initiation factor 4G isoform X2 [Cryptomeria japonica]